MRVAVAGASGLIGSALMPELIAAGHQPVPMVRRPRSGGGEHILWDPASSELEPDAFEDIDAVINLAGRGIADARWSGEQKREILQSRVSGNRLIAETIARSSRGPKAFIAGSAIGFYGDTGDTAVTESASSGDDFLSDVCRSLEDATATASDAGCRVVTARTGIVLSKSGGALAQLLPFFRIGLGGRIGAGRQYWSWISLDDELRSLTHLLDADVSGPVNLVSPDAVTNSEFTKVLGHVLHRPTMLPTPKIALWARLGRELTNALLYTSTRVEPAALLSTGFEFTHSDLESALRAILNRPSNQTESRE